MISLGTKLLAGVTVALALSLGVLGYLYRGELRTSATLAASLKTATDANADLVRERDRYKADVARVQAQANKLTTDLRALQGAATTLRENLSDAAKNCPLLDGDRRAVHCLLYPEDRNCRQDGASPPR